MFRFRSDEQAAPAARQVVRDHGSALPEQVLSDVMLCVTELVTNSVQHAQVSAEDSIVLAVQFSENTVRCEVRDDGPGFEPPATPPPEDADAGWGLFLVEQLADAWGVGDGGKGVWFEIRRDRAQEDAPGSESASTAA